MVYSGLIQMYDDEVQYTIQCTMERRVTKLWSFVVLNDDDDLFANKKVTVESLIWICKYDKDYEQRMEIMREYIRCIMQMMR